MTEEEWRSNAWRTLDELANEGHSGPEGQARALVTVAMLLKSCPLTITRRHGYADAGLFDLQALAARTRLMDDDLAIPRADEAIETLFVALAVQLKALDELHHELEGDLAPAEPNEDWRVAYPGGEAFLIPRGGLHRSSGRREEEGPWRIALRWRDLMPHHRLLPVELNGMAIELHWRDMAGAWPASAPFGAGFFSDLEFLDDLPGEDFVVTGVTCADHDRQVRSRLEAAHDTQCVALVLPELTMPPEQVDVLRDHLRQRIHWASAQAMSAPALVVAGSWHVPVDDAGRMSNVAPVLDAYGEPILHHTKLLAYNAHGAPERIVAGDRLHVLVTEDRLIGFGICLDFCERLDGAYFPSFDVDYALVTSCGEDKTMLGHIATARDMITRFRSRAFVVQHRYPPFTPPSEKQPIGYVLPPRDDPQADPNNTRVNDVFSVHTSD